jgi:carbamoyltransferase
MEFGPRALGNRSILADPRIPTMQRDLNLKIKFRENFRPFAPAILQDHVNAYFDYSGSSPYMLIVSNLKDCRRKSDVVSDQSPDFFIDKLNNTRSEIPAVTHVDYSARIQTITQEGNPKFYSILKAFYQKTNCPILVNTSFNVMDEPIVNTPFDAINCYINTGIDLLVLGNFLVEKVRTTRPQTPTAI